MIEPLKYEILESFEVQFEDEGPEVIESYEISNCLEGIQSSENNLVSPLPTIRTFVSSNTVELSPFEQLAMEFPSVIQHVHLEELSFVEIERKLPIIKSFVAFKTVHCSSNLAPHLAIKTPVVQYVRECVELVTFSRVCHFPTLRTYKAVENVEFSPHLAIKSPPMVQHTQVESLQFMEFAGELPALMTFRAVESIQLSFYGKPHGEPQIDQLFVDEKECNMNNKEKRAAVKSEQSEECHVKFGLLDHLIICIWLILVASLVGLLDMENLQELNSKNVYDLSLVKSPGHYLGLTSKMAYFSAANCNIPFIWYDEVNGTGMI